MTEEERASEKRKHESVVEFLSTTPVAAGKRLGILDLTAPGRELGIHQTSCAKRFLLALSRRPFPDASMSLLAMHPMGSGKTITAIACVACLYKMVPRLEDFVVLIVAPKSVTEKWCATVRSWTTLGDRVVMAAKEGDLTAETFRGPTVIVTTKDVLVAARKTYMHWDGEERVWKPGTKPVLSFAKRARLRAGMVDGELPRHPLFAHVGAPMGDRTSKPVTLLCCDEAHEQCNPETQYGGVGAELARAANFVIGLSGTPVTSDPAQAAHLCHLLNARPAHLQDPKAWEVAGAGKHTINEETVSTFHEEVCDLADPDLLDHSIRSATVHLRFDPFIGRRADGTYDGAQRAKHNAHVNAAPRAPWEGEGGDRNGLSMCTTAVQLCFSATLGMHGADAFRKRPELYAEALEQPSQQMRLVWRMLRHRQGHGRVRIVVYSPAATMLRLLRDQLARWGGCGRLFLYTGKESSAPKRQGMIDDFLGPSTLRGVLLISGAGAVGTTLCPGCETLFVVGDIPWTKAELRQAESRVHRMTQKAPVEIVHFVPRGSVVEDKYRVHQCEADRLYPAIEKGNFEHFTREKRHQWKLRGAIRLAPVNELGNYYSAAPGAPPPALADDVALPPVSFPVAGFVEAPCTDCVAFDDDAAESRKRAHDDAGA